jgi:hypothetical protein
MISHDRERDWKNVDDYLAMPRDTTIVGYNIHTTPTIVEIQL